MRNIKLIIVHCTDSRWGNVHSIRKWHKRRGWKDIGYHFVILNGQPVWGEKFSEKQNGVLEEGRNVEVSGAHAKGLNSVSIGICLVGKHHFTLEQFTCLRDLLYKLKKKYPKAKIIGHRDVGKHGGNAGGKTCPNFAASEFLKLCKL